MKPIDVVLENPENIHADVVIIGSGPGGSAAARTLARAGKNVIVLEAGPYLPPGSFSNDGLWATKTLYSDFGKKMTDGSVQMLALQGRGLGGGTLVNSGISFRPPEKSLRRWAEKSELKETTVEKLKPYLDDAEKTLQVTVIDEKSLGKNNILAADGLRKLGWRGAVIPRNAVGCVPCARCFFGCPSGAKRSTDKNFLPQAFEAGARIFVHAKVASLREQNGRIDAVLVHAVDEDGKIHGQFEVKANHFVLAAGAVGTAKLLLAQGLANSSGQVGKNLRFHPTSGCLGEFEDKVEAFHGITQGYYSDEFADEDMLLETWWAPAEAVALVLPGIGAGLLGKMSRFAHFGAVGGMIREEGSAEITLAGDGHVRVKYALTNEDQRRLTKVLYKSMEVLLAAGAKKVYSDSRFVPEISSIEALRAAEKKWPILGSSIILEGNHPQGSCRMHTDSKKGVVSEFGRSYDLKNLWIMDSSAFPDALGVNPQITIAALAIRNAEYLAGNFG